MLTFLLVLFYCLALPVIFWNPPWLRGWRHRLIGLWAAAMARVIGLKMEIEGPLPEPPFILVSNHLSYIDILPYWKNLNTTFIAKNEIRAWPLIGSVADLLGIIFIDRADNRDIRRVNELIRSHLGARQGIVFFPEGTSTRGEKVLPFNSPLLFYPALHHTPVHHACISYRVESGEEFEAWKDVCWWGEADFFPHFWNLLKIKSFTVTVRFGAEPVKSKDRKALAKKLYKCVETNFAPLYPGRAG